MKLLFTADLHAPADERPYRQLGLFAQRRNCTLVAVAGDLLDVFSKDPGTQIHSAVGWLKSLAGGVSHVAVCSGNHDPDGPNGADWLARAAAAVKAGNLLVDGASVVLPDGENAGPGLIVTCCPYWNIQERGAAHHAQLRQRAEAAWMEGAWLAEACINVPWVVLHHEPPADTKVAAGAWEADAGAGGGAFWAAQWCRTYRPDYLLCGHTHQSPFVEGGAWADRVPGSPTWAFNPGRGHATGSRLIEIDTATRLARWLSWDGEEADRRRVAPGP